MPLKPKNIVKVVIYEIIEKKCILPQCSLFFVYFLWKQWNKQKIIEKSTFSVKRNFFREIAYIPFFLTKKKMVIPRWDVNSRKNAENGIIYAILREKKWIAINS